MKPLFAINANSFPDNNLWVCVYFSERDNAVNNENNQSLCGDHKRNIYEHLRSFKYTFKKNANGHVLNFCGVSSTGSNPSDGIYSFTP